MGEAMFERERRFVVSDHSIVIGAHSELIVQAYVFSADGYVVRVRTIRSYEDPSGPALSSLGGKGPLNRQFREEYETPVSTEWAAEVTSRCTEVITKRRFQVISDGVWEVDEFLGDNTGLWIAELEGGGEIDAVPVPDWLLKEVTGRRDLSNEALARRPFSSWSPDEKAALAS